ncbi:15-hydroxyprostaglandin dehydrogenase [NAD(+)]-like isoform X1 [Diorhabda carinulata]|uniref:15-hydroxyprostaglandin dehydrogenase [NAD(+)]-like isoform X1 n=1 Tax=Diorhabda carinulata TaxID=1163345 RepID=UPI0025A188FD|nr:15-hydroxyprostaglandin dehydrogenase [NAD(+)]-like isoform X1 [Diorhabda carinulata]
MFDVCDKVALITGGASGLGLSYAKELLRNGIKAVTISDIDDKAAEVALAEIENEFGHGKAIFIKTDVSSKSDFEAAFIRTVEVFKNVDILINNAGIYNDLQWEKEVDVNIRGTINGIILGLELYLKKYKQGDEAVILNTSSIAGIRPGPWMPIYGATKFAIVGMTLSWGDEFHFQRTKVRVLAICPGGTHTSLFRVEQCALHPDYMEAQKMANEKSGPANRQSSDFVAVEGVKLLKYAHNGSLWVVESGKPAYEYVFPVRDSFKNNVVKEV